MDVEGKALEITRMVDTRAVLREVELEIIRAVKRGYPEQELRQAFCHRAVSAWEAFSQGRRVWM